MNNMIKITLEDKIFQGVISEISEFQIKEMREQRWYKDEIAECKIRLKARGAELKAANINLCPKCGASISTTTSGHYCSNNCGWEVIT